MPMATRKSKAIVAARRTVTTVKRKIQDERMIGAGSCALGGVAGAVLDSRAESTTLGDTPITRNFAYGLGLVFVGLFVKKLPLQAGLLGAGMGLLGAGSYTSAQNVMADNEAPES